MQHPSADGLRINRRHKFAGTLEKELRAALGIDEKPFLKGTHASTAFCLLFKLWTLKLTVKQIEGMIDNADSPHIRAIGFLYLRYVCDFGQLWDWFGDYLEDDEEVRIEGGVRPRVVTIGKVCRDLLMEQKWLGTILPRIPVPVMRELEVKVKAVAVPGGSGGAAAPPPPIPQRPSRSHSPPPRDSGFRRASSEDLDYGDEPGPGRFDDRRRDSRDSRDYGERYGSGGYGRGGNDVGYGRGGGGGRDEYYNDRRGRSRSPPAQRYRDDGPYNGGRGRSISPLRGGGSGRGYDDRERGHRDGGRRSYDDDRRRNDHGRDGERGGRGGDYRR
ncbi:UNVERIFIED_CONTAM: hypothetical protein HDU68_009375 [Siphonaria sp. JEL0065]|nr:hypothetical protein HDU68_009375 [Siphonaria sp. JEL0065]